MNDQDVKRCSVCGTVDGPVRPGLAQGGDEVSDKCKYTLIGDYGCYPRVAYKSECGFELVVLEGYDIGTSGERLDTLRMPMKTCARCGKEISLVDPKIPSTLGPYDAIAHIRRRIGDGFAMEDFEAAQWIESRDAAQRQAGREARCDNCDRDSAINAFRMDELDAVMLSNDKWLDGTALKNNPATRAADAREIALKAIEKERARADKLEKRYAALVEAARKTRAWIDGILCQCDDTVDHVCDRCVLIKSIDKALSDLDKIKE